MKEHQIYSTSLTLLTPCISESFLKVEINLNVYFHTSLWCLKSSDKCSYLVQFQNHEICNPNTKKFFFSSTYKMSTPGTIKEIITEILHNRHIKKLAKNWNTELRREFNEFIVNTATTISNENIFLGIKLLK